MLSMTEIRCQRECESHLTKLLQVHVGGPTPYRDLTDIPEQFARNLRMWVYDTDVQPVDGGPYCPARDVVSETIANLGTWEPAETTLALQVFSTADPDQWVMDLGSHIGWYSLLAASFGLGVVAVDADADNLVLLDASARENGWNGGRLQQITTVHHRFGADNGFEDYLPDGRVRFVKMDLEGAEDDATAAIWPLLTEGKVDHLLMEVSPCFAPYYPELVADLAAIGYVPYLVPDKAQPPLDLTGDIPETMEEFCLSDYSRPALKNLVAGFTQRDMWFRRHDAQW